MLQSLKNALKLNPHATGTADIVPHSKAEALIAPTTMDLGELDTAIASRGWEWETATSFDVGKKVVISAGDYNTTRIQAWGVGHDITSALRVAYTRMHEIFRLLEGGSC